MTGSQHDSAREWAARAALSSEAAEWFVRLRDDRLPTSHRERNVRWLKQSPEHIAELLRVQQVYKALRAAKLADRPPGTPAGTASNVIELLPRQPPPLGPSRARPRFQSWKIAAAVACVTVSLLLGYMLKVSWLDRTVETDLGEWREVVLSDGTEVWVGPGSRLRVAFGDDRRTVHLVRGEAMFHVATDAARPFFVESEMISVLAVGTEFRVSRRGGEDVVAVTEGTVAVYRDGRKVMPGAALTAPAEIAAETGGVALAAGEQVSVTPATRAKPVAKKKVNVDYEHAWAGGWLIYEGKTIGELAGEFNRRNRVKIVVSEPDIAGRRLAFFRAMATDPESFVTALAADSDITVIRDRPDELRIERSARRLYEDIYSAGALP